jgi:hypothetical protein
MKNTRKALEMAIEALEDNQHYIAENERHTYVMLYNEIIDKCKEALEQPAQEPNCYGDGNVYRGLRSEDSKVKTYHVNTHPHQWQGLTDDEIARLVLINEVDKSGDTGFARLIEQALKEKNT